MGIELFDLTGKRLHTELIAIEGRRFHTAPPLNGDLAAGMYVVHVTVGERLMTERLVIVQ